MNLEYEYWAFQKIYWWYTETIMMTNNRVDDLSFTIEAWDTYDLYFHPVEPYIINLQQIIKWESIFVAAIDSTELLESFLSLDAKPKLRKSDIVKTSNVILEYTFRTLDLIF